jgi:hypothetical protein
MERQMTLRHPITSLSLALLTSLTVAGAASTAEVGGRPFYAVLTGAAEVPGPGDPDGSGTARITINPGKSEICWTLTAEDIGTATAAHIHEGDITASGGVVVALSAPTGGTASGCRFVDSEEVAEILADPDEYYVNVHSEDFPAGAIRGQLSSKKIK